MVAANGELPTDLSTLKVVELKEILKARSLPVSGTKAQLIERLQQRDQQQSEAEVEAESTEPTTLPQAETTESTTSKKRPDTETDEENGSNKRTKLDDSTMTEEEGKEEVPRFENAPVEEIVEAQTTNGHSGEAENGGVKENGKREEGSFNNQGTTTTAEETRRSQVEGQETTSDVKAEEQEEEEEEPPVYEVPEENENLKPTDMYLDTIDRSSLDFDFERLCSVTLSHHHIYSCLVCGKFFQGRGPKSAAYAHSIGGDHHVFINLESKKVYVLPDGYEVSDPSLSDIQYLLSPSFTPSLLSTIDHSLLPHHDLLQRPYYPGFIGLNNIKSNSYINSILVSLSHVRPLRDYFILSERFNEAKLAKGGETELVKRWTEFLKKVWNPKMFKSQVSPHELLQQIDLDSKGKFKLNADTTTGEGGAAGGGGAGGDPGEFLSWFLNQLHRDLGGNRKPNSSIIYSTFQGELRIDDQQVLKTGEYGTKPKFDLDREIKSTKSPFLFLTLDLPPPPLFQSHLQNDIIPQVSLTTLLSKYNGQTTSELLLLTKSKEGGGGGEGKNELSLRRYKLEKLPEFVVLWVKRFRVNRFGEEEKNPTIVNFPLRGVDFKDYVEQDDDGLAKHYDLVSSTTHTSLAGTARLETQWKTYVHLTPLRDSNDNYLPTEDGRQVKEEDEKWFECQDLQVNEIEKSLVGLGETYIQIWERRRPEGKHDLKIETPKQKVKGVAGQVLASQGKSASSTAGSTGKK